MFYFIEYLVIFISGMFFWCEIDNNNIYQAAVALFVAAGASVIVCAKDCKSFFID